MTRPGSRRSGPLPAGREDRYALMLVLLVVSYLVSAFGSGRALTVARLAVFLVTLLLTLRTSGVRARVLRVVMTSAVAGGLGTGVVALVGHSGTGLGLAHVWVAVVLGVTVVTVVRRILSHRVVTLQTILGAISAYVLVGLLFAAVYAAIGQFQPRRFFAETGSTSLTLCQYYSFTTLTTLGYGDLTPATNAGRAIAMIEALSGQVFLVTLVARLVSLFPTGGGTGHGGRSGSGRRPRGPARRTGRAGRGRRAARAVRGSRTGRRRAHRPERPRRPYRSNRAASPTPRVCRGPFAGAGPGPNVRRAQRRGALGYVVDARYVGGFSRPRVTPGG